MVDAAQAKNTGRPSRRNSLERVAVRFIKYYLDLLKRDETYPDQMAAQFGQQNDQ